MIKTNISNCNTGETLQGPRHFASWNSPTPPIIFFYRRIARFCLFTHFLLFLCKSGSFRSSSLVSREVRCRIIRGCIIEVPAKLKPVPSSFLPTSPSVGMMDRRLVVASFVGGRPMGGEREFGPKKNDYIKRTTHTDSEDRRKC